MVTQPVSMVNREVTVPSDDFTNFHATLATGEIKTRAILLGM